MKLEVHKLSEKHLPMVNAFSCVEKQATLQKFNSKIRKRIKKHSEEMESFLKTKAYDEQKEGINTTHLFIDIDTQKIIAYLSLCNDNIKLDLSERDNMSYSYMTIPALKIARLAVATEYQHNGIGKMLINFAIYLGMEIREMSGLAFLTLDCYEHRRSYYESIGFIKNMIQPIMLPYDTPISMRLEIKGYLEKMNINK